MLDNIRHGICYYGPDRRVIAANALAAEFGGHPPGDLRTGPLASTRWSRSSWRSAPSAAMRRRSARMAREMDRSRPARYIRQNADGRILEITSDPTPDGGFVVTSSDISALVDAEQAVRHRAGILQAMLDNSRQGIMLFDAEGLVLAANGNAAALNGLPPRGAAAGPAHPGHDRRPGRGRLLRCRGAGRGARPGAGRPALAGALYPAAERCGQAGSSRSPPTAPATPAISAATGTSATSSAPAPSWSARATRRRRRTRPSPASWRR